MSHERSEIFVRCLLVPVVCAVTLAMPFVVWLGSTGNLFAYFTRAVPPGQALYVLSKLFGLLAIVMFWFQCMAALAKDTPVLRGFFRLDRSHHALLGAATFATALTHLILFVVASSFRTKHAAFNLLWPQFDQGFYRAYVSLGAMAFWLLVIAVFAGWRRLRGGLPWRWLHRLGFVVFALAFLHGISVGSETRFGVMKYVYAFVGLSLGTAVISRMWVAAQRFRQRSGLVEGSAHARTTRESISPTE